MNTRRPRIDELLELKKLHIPFEDQFKFPNFNELSSVYVVVDEEDKIIGFGAVQPIFEAVIILDQSKSADSRFEALEVLEERCCAELATSGITQVHAFVQDKKFENLLRNRFNYKNTKGTALVKVIDGKR